MNTYMYIYIYTHIYTHTHTHTILARVLLSTNVCTVKNISSQLSVTIVYYGVSIMACGCRRSSANGIYDCAVQCFCTLTECTIT